MCSFPIKKIYGLVVISNICPLKICFPLYFFPKVINNHKTHSATKVSQDLTYIIFNNLFSDTFKC